MSLWTDILGRFGLQKKSLRMVGEDAGWVRIFDSHPGAFQQDFHSEANHERVMRFQAIYACMTLISQDIGKLRPRLMQRQASGIWREKSNPQFDALLQETPNTYQNRMQFFQYWIACKLSRGQAYALKERDDRGVVHALHLLDPWRVTPLVSDMDGSVFYRLQNDFLAGLPEEITVPAREIIHDPMVTLFHPLCGVTPIFACGMAAMQGLKIQANSVNFFTNMSRPSGILTTPTAISDETAKRLKAEWTDGFGGKKIGNVAVLGDGLHYEAMSVNAVDAQLVEQLKWSGETVCSVFHVPTYMVGLAPPPPNNNIEALTQQYLGQCLQSLIESIELGLDLGLDLNPPQSKAPPQRVQFDLDGLLRMDTSSRYEANSKGVAGGWLAPNEARRRENLEPVDGGDSPYLQQQNFSLAALAARDAKGPAPSTAPALPPAAKDMPPADLDWRKSVEQRLADNTKRLEARKYMGVWKQGVYLEGNMVTLKGSMWVCMGDTNSRPGTDASWKLAVKKGLDARQDRGLPLIRPREQR